jgi:hypothetical protein
MIVADKANPRGIVWIASYPKSGNTWVRIFLHHLMKIGAGLPPDENDLAHLHESTRQEAAQMSLFEKFLGKPVKDADWQEIVEIRPQVQSAIAERANGIVLIKTHNAMGKLLGVPTINLSASAGAIYIVRNPLDIVLSLSPHAGVSIDDAITVMETENFKNKNSERTAFEVWGSWSEHVGGWTGQHQDPVLVLRYEDMLADPIKSFTAILRHLRQNPTSDAIAKAVELSSFERSRALEEKFGFEERTPHADRFFRVGRAGQWREQLSDAQVSRIVAAHEAQMRRFGYLPL